MIKYRMAAIGCSKTKIERPESPKQDWFTPGLLYTGQLFRKRVDYAGRIGLPWVALSAKYGAWRNDVEQPHYDLMLSQMSKADQAIWHVSVAKQLTERMLFSGVDAEMTNVPFKPHECEIELHAGALYADTVGLLLMAVGFSVKVPCRGLGIGEQLAAYTSGPLSVSAAGGRKAVHDA